jgi:RHS repeat-associated protein
VGTEVTRYLWDGDQIIRELDGATQTVATLIHGLGLGADVGSLVKAERGEQSQYFHYDWRGSVTALTDQTSQSIQSYLYNAFGEITQSSGSAVNPYQFSSKQFDTNSGLSYFGRRHYSAHLGRFSSQDPKGYINGLNTYAYVKNNPLRLIDILGLKCAALEESLASVYDGYNEKYAEWLEADDLFWEIEACLSNAGLESPCSYSLDDLSYQSKEVQSVLQKVEDLADDWLQAKEDYEDECGDAPSAYASIVPPPGYKEEPEDDPSES